MTDAILDQIPAELRAEAAAVLRESPDLQRRLELTETTAWSSFRPRPDRPDLLDEQMGFCLAKDQMSFLVGGNAAGTTEAAMWKLARFVLHDQPPPRPNTPFWIISNSYDQVCGVCWDEKLCGHAHIPEEEVEWNRIRWFRPKMNWPFSIPLRPWPIDRGGDGKKSWVLEFKSFEQGRTALQAKSIGGFCFSEQFPWQLLVETLRGCRDYMFPGAQFCEFTPIDPDLCLELEKVMESPPPGWRFYRANTDCNRPNLAEGWYESFFGAVPEEMQETRRTGALATFEGVIYQSFNTAIHVVRDDGAMTPNAIHYRGIDWGASTEHPFVCIFGCVDAVGDWYVYDEYWSPDQGKTTLDHLIAVANKSHAWGWKGAWTEKKSMGAIWVAQHDQWHRETYADPSRPGEINEFGARGIPTLGAATNVFKGIDTVRSLLKVRETTGRPKLLIHQRCVHLIDEMRKYRWRRGKKPLETLTGLNPAAPPAVPLKRDDDTCFVAGTLIATPTGAVPIEFLKPGDLVWSHLGLTTVLGAGSFDNRPIVRLSFSDACDILCTPDHLFATVDGSWVQAEELAGIKVQETCRFSKLSRAVAGGSNELSMAVSGGIVTRKTTQPPTGCILDGVVELVVSCGRSNSTCRFGKIHSAPCHRMSSCITSTATPETTPWPTLDSFQQATTLEFTRLTWPRQSRQRDHGIVVNLDGPGTENMPSKFSATGLICCGNASVAAKLTALGRQAMCDFAVHDVAVMPAGKLALTTSNGSALAVEGLLRSTVTRRRSIVPVAVRPRLVGAVKRLSSVRTVYNLATVDGSYFANGVLVSNCDALRYMLHSVSLTGTLAPSSMSYRDYTQQRRSVLLEANGNGNGNGQFATKNRR